MNTIFKIFIAAIFISSCNTNKQSQEIVSTIKNIDAKAFKELVDKGDGIILDVRSPDEILDGHITNASTINIYDPEFVSKINLIQKDKQILVYCKSGGRGAKASEILKENGFKKIYNLTGGITDWIELGFPITIPENKKDKNIQQLSLNNFKELLKTDKIVLIDFHTVWCAPCRKMAPIVDRIEEKYKDKAVVMRIDVDKSKGVGKAYDITGVPVFILFKNGREIWKYNGLISEKELIKQVEKHL